MPWLANIDHSLLGSLFSLRGAQRKLQGRIDARSVEQYKGDPRLAHSVAELEKALTASAERIRAIETKATSTVVGVGLAVTILGSATAIVGRDGPLASPGLVWRLIAAASLTLGIAFLLLSGYLALRTYAVGRVYGPRLDDLPPLVAEDESKKVMLYSIEQNYDVGTMKTNLLSVSFGCLRNGIVFVGILGVILIYGSLFASPQHMHGWRW